MTSSTPAHRTRRALFALYAANAISAVGNQLSNIAIPWFVLQATGSASQTGITAAVSIVPTIIAAFFGGGIVDRFGFRRMSVASDAASALAVALVPLLYTVDALSFPVLLVLVFLGALLDAPGVTARQSMLPELAEAGGLRLERATSNTQVIERGALLLGAPLAGILVAALGTTNVLWLNAASFAVSALLIASMVPAIRVPAPDESSGADYLEEMRSAVRFILKDRLILAVLLTVMMTNLLDAAKFSVIFPVYADEVFGSAVALGLIFGFSGGGAVIGALAYGGIGHRFPRRPVFIGSFLLLAAPSLVLAALERDRSTRSWRPFGTSGYRSRCAAGSSG